MNIAYFQILPIIVIYTIIEHNLILYNNESTIFLKKYHLYLDKLVISRIFLKLMIHSCNRYKSTFRIEKETGNLPLLAQRKFISTFKSTFPKSYKSFFKTWQHYDPRKMAKFSKRSKYSNII